MSALLKRLNPRILICSNVTYSHLSEAVPIIINVDLELQSLVFWGLVNADNSAIAFMQHSSGTTGLKKGVRLSHGKVLTQLESYGAAIALEPGADVIASWLPLYHDMGLITAFLMPAIWGVPIISLDAMAWTINPTSLLTAIESHRATLCWLPNFAFHHIARLARSTEKWDLNSMRLFVSCSEPCRVAAFDAFLARFANCGVTREKLQVSFALAENVFAATQTKLGQPARSSINPEFLGYLSCGKPINGVRIAIQDVVGNTLPEGAVGEVVISGGCLFDGYDALPELTRDRLRRGMYYTGDIGFLDQGELFVVGRQDDVLNINGKKLIGHELEDSLNNIDDIAPGRVLAYSAHSDVTGATELRVAAELASSDNDGPRTTALAEAIRHRIFATTGVRPSGVDIVPKGFLIKSTSGKLSRQATIKKLALFHNTKGCSEI
jgi:acyl-CoA synthetase (AMP-forming)/AMP-acid ligase II